MGFIGGITVVSNFGYQKPDRPDLLVSIIDNVSPVPVLITAAQKTHEQIGEMMSLGLEFKRTYKSLDPAATGSRMNSPLFLLAYQEPASTPSINALQRTLAQLPRPLDLWIVNFSYASCASAKLKAQNCFADSQSRGKMNGYKYKLYHCQ